MTAVEINDTNRHAANALIEKYFFTLDMVCRGEVIAMQTQDGFLCEKDGIFVGVITFMRRGDMLDITALCTDVQGQGVGTMLLTMVKEQAVLQNMAGVSLITTNDNLNALYFYQRQGFLLSHADIGAVTRARAIKPQIPLFGEYDIPIKDELELVWRTQFKAKA